ncbi:hypothetical protein BGZ50_001717 [Haplosporangium sp. Z 11]|nr:hypothetical protein BGZ50_001717 [Haplosporangium sp. Z 11]
MNVVKEIQRLNAREATLSTSHSLSGSWHEQYKDSAHVFVGGIPFHLTEGDIICVMSQFGEIAGINLVRDKDTGKSKGFAFIKYADQRSTVLAVDNLNGVQIGGRTIRVDHVQNYKVPKVFDADGNEVEQDEDMVNNAVPKPIQDSSEDESSSESEVDDTGIDIDDPMREFLLKKRKKAAKKAKRKAEKESNGGKSESKAERRARKEAKRAAKKEKKESRNKDKDKDGGSKDKDMEDKNYEQKEPKDISTVAKDFKEKEDSKQDADRIISDLDKGKKGDEKADANTNSAQPSTTTPFRRSKSRSPVSRRPASYRESDRSGSSDRHNYSSSHRDRSRERRRDEDEDRSSRTGTEIGYGIGVVAGTDIPLDGAVHRHIRVMGDTIVDRDTEVAAEVLEVVDPVQAIVAVAVAVLFVVETGAEVKVLGGHELHLDSPV